MRAGRRWIVAMAVGGAACLAAPLFGWGSGVAQCRGEDSHGAPGGVVDGEEGRAGRRPRVGLVLGGGGARGIAHVGVLQVLEELRVPVDVVVGTSMGALVGGLYAAGISPDSMVGWLRRADWDDLFYDAPPFEDLPIRRKEEARAFPMRLVTGLGRGGIRLPQGLITGHKLTRALRSMTLGAALVTDFDSLAVAFRAVATDLESGQARVFGGGDLVDALRASMSVPGVFAPYPVDDRLYVDGGIVANLPIQVACDMGAEVVIAVDVGSRLEERSELEGVLAITSQVSRIVTRSNTERALGVLGGADILVAPELGETSSTDFGRGLATVAMGREAARAELAALSALSVDAATYAADRARRARLEGAPQRVDYVVVWEPSGRAPGNLARRLQTRPGRLDTAAVNRDIAYLHGLGLYDHVDYRLAAAPEGTALVFRLRKKSWGPWFLRYRFSISDAVGREGSYGVATQLLVPQVNDWGAEVVTAVEIGAVRSLATEFYQPLGTQSRFFVAPWFRHQSTPVDIMDGGRAVARYRTAFTGTGVRAGVHPRQDTEVAVGLEWGRVRGEPAIGTGTLDGFEARTGTARLRFDFNGLDSPQFPGSGGALGLGFQADRQWLGSDGDFHRLDGVALAAATRGRNSVFGFLLASTALGSQLPPYARPALGGFLLLSGYRAGAVSGQHMVFGRLLLARAIAGDDLRLAVSLEAGNAWERRAEVDLEALRGSAALVLGTPTPLGPVYVGVGGRRLDALAFYFEVGRGL